MLSLFVHAVTASVLPLMAWVGLYAAVRRLDQGRSPRVVLLATAAGVVAAVVVATLEQTTNWISRELLALWLLPGSVALALVGQVWVWLPGTGRVRPRWGSAVLALVAALVCVLELPDLFTHAAAIVPHDASPLTSDALANLSGYLLGIAVVGLSAWAVYRASVGASSRVTQLATSLVLALLGLGQLVSLARVLIVRGFVDPPSWMFDTVVIGLNSQWLMTAGITLACVLPIGSALSAGRSVPQPLNPAEGRLRRAAVLSRRRFIGLTGAGLGITVVALTAGRAAAETEPSLSAPEPLASDDRDVWVMVSAIDDGHLHRFAYDAADGAQVRFIAIRKSSNAFVAALDACNICGPAGYYEADGRVICLRCGVAMNIATIGFAGGCNPIPIDYSVTDGRLLVARKVLEANAKVFE
jgi:uncharacterized membrane protein